MPPLTYFLDCRPPDSLRQQGRAERLDYSATHWSADGTLSPVSF